MRNINNKYACGDFTVCFMSIFYIHVHCLQEAYNNNNNNTQCFTSVAPKNNSSTLHMITALRQISSCDMGAAALPCCAPCTRYLNKATMWN